MISGFIDTTVTVHLYRGDQSAVTWLKAQEALAVTSIAWLELIYGANGRRGQRECIKLLNQFTLVHLTAADQEWAMKTMLLKRLSDGVAINDCLIAAVCHRLQLPLYTHNIKHISRLLDPALVHQPY
ncbi:MAG: PIN domain-containing protein [Caldilineaceae bacterium]